MKPQTTITALKLCRFKTLSAAVVALAAALWLSPAIGQADTMFVSDTGGNIYQYNTATRAERTFASQFPTAAGLAFDSTGNLYVEDGQRSIYEYTPQGSPSSFAFLGVPGGAGASQLAFDSAGNLYAGAIGYLNGPVIYKITPSGSYSLFTTIGPSGIANNQGMAFNSAGDLFVDSPSQASAGGLAYGDSIYKVTLRGSVSTFALGFAPGGNPSAQIDSSGLAFDNAGNLYVAGGGVGNESIVKFTPSGSESTFATGLGYVGGMAFDSAGNLFTVTHDSNGGSGSVVKITPSGSESTFASVNDPFYIAIAKFAQVALLQNQSFASAGITLNTYGTSSTTAKIIGGTASQNTTVTLQQGTPTQDTPYRVTDVVQLSGTGTDPFVLQMSYNPTVIAADGINPLSLYLGWYDTAAGVWTNSVYGNTGNSVANEIFANSGIYNSSTDFVLGDWGVDTAHDTVWAVLDHNSEFAINYNQPPSPAAVPEPGMVGLWLVGGLMVWRYGVGRKQSAVS